MEKRMEEDPRMRNGKEEWRKIEIRDALADLIRKGFESFSRKKSKFII